MKPKLKFRTKRIGAIVAVVAALVGIIVANPASYEEIIESSALAESAASTSDAGENSSASSSFSSNANGQPLATEALARLEIKGRAPKTGYNREEFYKTWPVIEGCSLRQRIIRREVGDSAQLDSDNCTVLAGEFDEPYTGSRLVFHKKSEFSKGIQIDHVVALSDAWQKGAQYKTAEERYNMATDPLNLLAVDSSANQGKSDGDAATWLPPNKSFRCQYVARQVSVKAKYQLWVTQAEHDAIAKVLETCPNEPAVGLEK